MKKCPVCDLTVEDNTTVCPRCKWTKLGTRLNATDEERDELYRVRLAWQTKLANLKKKNTTKVAAIPDETKTVV